MKFVSAPEGQTIVGRSTGYTPANPVAIRDPRYLRDYYAKAPNMAAAAKSADAATALFVWPGENAVKVSAEIHDRLRDLVALKRTPEQAQAEIEKTVRTLVPNVG